MYQSLFFIEFVSLFLLSKFLTKSLLRLFFKFTKSKKITVVFLFCLFFPGTVIHELAHLLAAGLLFVKTGSMEIMPKIMDDEIRLGSVQVAKTDPFRRTIIGVAPVLLGMAIIFGTLFYLQPLAEKNSGIYIFLFYVIFSIGNTLFSSKKDLEGTVEFVLAFVFFLVVLFIVRGEIAQVFFQILQRPEMVNFFRSADLFLLAPILIDLITIFTAGFLIGRKD
jgi:hypothetical protein